MKYGRYSSINGQPPVVYGETRTQVGTVNEVSCAPDLTSTTCLQLVIRLACMQNGRLMFMQNETVPIGVDTSNRLEDGGQRFQELEGLVDVSSVNEGNSR